MPECDARAAIAFSGPVDVAERRALGSVLATGDRQSS